MSPQNLYVVRVRPLSNMTGVLMRRGRDPRDACTEEKSCDDTVRRHQSARLGRGPRERPNLLTPWSCT